MSSQVLSTPKIKLEPYQDLFIFSPARYPALLASIGTGKTMCAIFRMNILMEKFPNNLGIVVRKEFTDLKDSTMKDWELYTGRAVPTDKDFKYKNGSVVLFRHGSEINVLKNINAGAIFIEQAEEFGSNETFEFLTDRLRRKEAGFRTMFMTANSNGHNWVWNDWVNLAEETKIIDFETKQIEHKRYTDVEIDGQKRKMFTYHCIEANMYANKKNLAPDFIADKERQKISKPEHFKRYVLNDHEAQVEGKVFSEVDRIVDLIISRPIKSEPQFEYTLGVDLARSVDNTVLTVYNRQMKRVDYFERMTSENRTSWNYQKEKIKAVALAYNNALICIDSTGIGDPIVEDLQRMGLNIFYQEKEDSNKTTPGVKFTNISKENLIEKLKVAIEMQMITIPNDPFLIAELKDFESTILPSGAYRYSAPDGKHDDCVISLALALWASYSSMYEKDYEPPKKEDPTEKFWDNVKKDVALKNNQQIYGQAPVDSDRFLDEGNGREL